MTDEEKAIEYADKNIDIAISMYNPNAISLVEQAYLDGLTEGRKEGYEQGMKKACEICKQQWVKAKNV
jgi:flagellar biosynthesis/type III secretory pathway protein FliH